MGDILFPTLELGESSSLIFDFTNTPELTVKYRKHFKVHSSSLIDSTTIGDKTSFVSNAAAGD